MNELKVFENPAFGQVRTIEENGKVLFCASDVAKALGYASPKDAVSAHTKGAVKRRTLTNGGKQEINFIPEGDVYRLITHSKLPGAEEFERWVFDEVLPAIRKTGSYTNPKAPLPDLDKQRRAEAMLLNAKSRVAKQMQQLWDRSGVEPQYQALALNDYYDGLQVPRIALQAEATALYDATTIAKRLGIMSASGNPHAQAVGAIINKLSISPEERAETPYCRNGHDGVSTQYTESVEQKVIAWLGVNDHPTVISSGDKVYKVKYAQ